MPKHSHDAKTLNVLFVDSIAVVVKRKNDPVV